MIHLAALIVAFAIIVIIACATLRVLAALVCAPFAMMRVGSRYPAHPVYIPPTVLPEWAQREQYCFEAARRRAANRN
jgi:hypothetical protein